jgi:3-oxoacyl-[acyl-carrier protein] reductase|tara:strand:+ start:519 stop:1229 length:711 start_codon:yes stop_codon:yes gene_type:complete
MFESNTAFVTGGTGSIGEAICNNFIKNNCAKVYASTTNLDKAKNLNKKINFINMDLKEISSNHLKDNINFEPDFLILNAGLNKDNLFLRMSEEEWNDVINVNLNSTFKLVKHFIRGMVKRRFGRIVFITSVVAFTGNPGQTNYIASKSALTGFCKSLSLEVASRNITVNCVAPGFINSNMTDKLTEMQKNNILDKVPMKKLGNPSDIADTVSFLCSDKSSYITGQTIHVNGGLALI